MVGSNRQRTFTQESAVCVQCEIKNQQRVLTTLHHTCDVTAAVTFVTEVT